jgi:hypothetical protein
MFKRIAMAFTLASLVLLTGCATNYTTVREHKDLAESASHIASVVIVPADVSIELIAFTGDNERETTKEGSFAKSLYASAKTSLEGKGLTVVDYDFDKGVAENQNLAFAVTQCKESLNKAAAATLYKKPVSEKDKARFAESVGAAANVIAEATGADAMLLIDYKGFEKTAGMQTKDMAAGILLGVLTGTVAVAPSQGARVQVALVATGSGDILWTNVQGSGFLTTDSVSKPVFDKFPKVVFNQDGAAKKTVETAAATPAEAAK